MRVRYHVATSADGFIAAEDGSVDWLEAFDANEAGFADFFADIKGLVMGRATYDQVLGFGEWPYGDLPCVVLTSSDLCENSPAHVTACTPDPLRALDALREAGADDDVWIVGGARTATVFLLAHLIDTVELAVLPVMLGSGISAFTTLIKPYPLELIDVKQRPHGVLFKTYQPRR